MNKINTITIKHNIFKQRLSRLADPPKRLFYKSKLLSLEQPAVAIVGSRKLTPYGKGMTYRLAYDLAKQGIIIVSGLAFGADATAHQAALDAKGTTIAVLAGGLHAIYPERHTGLAKAILNSGGALISEYEPGTPCLPHQFVARNRIIAALAQGTIITEAAAKSGSLHTAQFALEIGDVVMAVPGLATNPMAQGCLNLLKTGATLVTNADDIFFALGWERPATSKQLPLPGSSPQETIILTLLAQGLSDGEELYKQSQLEIREFNQALTMLEITGSIRALGGNQWEST